MTSREPDGVPCWIVATLAFAVTALVIVVGLTAAAVLGGP